MFANLLKKYGQSALSSAMTGIGMYVYHSHDKRQALIRLNQQKEESDKQSDKQFKKQIAQMYDSDQARDMAQKAYYRGIEWSQSMSKN